MARLEHTELRRRCRLPILVVYRSPRDFPGKYVLRLFDVSQPTMMCLTSDTLEGIRAFVPPTMNRFPRSPKDDPCIVESYI